MNFATVLRTFPKVLQWSWQSLPRRGLLFTSDYIHCDYYILFLNVSCLLLLIIYAAYNCPWLLAVFICSWLYAVYNCFWVFAVYNCCSSVPSYIIPNSDLCISMHNLDCPNAPLWIADKFLCCHVLPCTVLVCYLNVLTLYCTIILVYLYAYYIDLHSHWLSIPYFLCSLFLIV